MLKLATEADYDELIRVGTLAQKLYQPELEVDVEKIIRMINLFLSEPNEVSVILMYMDGDKAIGVLGVRADEALFQRGKMAQDIFYFIDPDNKSPKVHKDLVDAYEYWAKKIGVRRMVMSCAEGPNVDRIAKVYGRKGFKPLERFFMKEI